MVVNRSETKKRKKNDTEESLQGNPKKTKVHAQRKFAQGANLSGPALTPIKDKDKLRPVNTISSPDQLLPSKRPNTEDFLTFLCFRRTSLLPPELDFFKEACRPEPQTPSDVTVKPSSSASTSGVTPKTKLSTKTPAAKIGAKKNYESGNKIQGVAVQALRRKYQEQRLEKQKPTNVNKLAQKVKGKNMMRTRSSVLVGEEMKIPKPQQLVKKVLPTPPGLRSGLQRIPIREKIKKLPLKESGLRLGLRSREKVVPTRILKKMTAEKKMLLMKKAQKKMRTRTVDEGGRLSDFSSDDNEPLLAVKKPKIRGMKPGIVRKNVIKTRSKGEETSVSQVAARPTRKTKEAAAIYMEMLTKKLVSPEKSDEDKSSVDSFPELPNAKRNEQREIEIRSKALAQKLATTEDVKQGKAKNEEKKNIKTEPKKKAEFVKKIEEKMEVESLDSKVLKSNTKKHEVLKTSTPKPVKSEEKEEVLRPSTRSRSQEELPQENKKVVRSKPVALVKSTSLERDLIPKKSNIEQKKKPISQSSSRELRVSSVKPEGKVRLKSPPTEYSKPSKESLESTPKNVDEKKVQEKSKVVKKDSKLDQIELKKKDKSLEIKVDMRKRSLRQCTEKNTEEDRMTSEEETADLNVSVKKKAKTSLTKNTPKPDEITPRRKYTRRSEAAKVENLERTSTDPDEAVATARRSGVTRKKSESPAKSSSPPVKSKIATRANVQIEELSESMKSKSPVSPKNTKNDNDVKPSITQKPTTVGQNPSETSSSAKSSPKKSNVLKALKSLGRPRCIVSIVKAEDQILSDGSPLLSGTRSGLKKKIDITKTGKNHEAKITVTTPKKEKETTKAETPPTKNPDSKVTPKSTSTNVTKTKSSESISKSESASEQIHKKEETASKQKEDVAETSKKFETTKKAQAPKTSKNSENLKSSRENISEKEEAEKKKEEVKSKESDTSSVTTRSKRPDSEKFKVPQKVFKQEVNKLGEQKEKLDESASFISTRSGTLKKVDEDVHKGDTKPTYVVISKPQEKKSDDSSSKKKVKVKKSEDKPPSNESKNEVKSGESRTKRPDVESKPRVTETAIPENKTKNQSKTSDENSRVGRKSTTSAQVMESLKSSRVVVNMPESVNNEPRQQGSGKASVNIKTKVADVDLKEQNGKVDSHTDAKPKKEDIKESKVEQNKTPEKVDTKTKETKTREGVKSVTTRSNSQEDSNSNSPTKKVNIINSPSSVPESKPKLPSPEKCEVSPSPAKKPIKESKSQPLRNPRNAPATAKAESPPEKKPEVVKKASPTLKATLRTRTTEEDSSDDESLFDIKSAVEKISKERSVSQKNIKTTPSKSFEYWNAHEDELKDIIKADSDSRKQMVDLEPSKTSSDSQVDQKLLRTEKENDSVNKVLPRPEKVDLVSKTETPKPKALNDTHVATTRALAAKRQIKVETIPTSQLTSKMIKVIKDLKSDVNYEKVKQKSPQDDIKTTLKISGYPKSVEPVKKELEKKVVEKKVLSVTSDTPKKSLKGDLPKQKLDSGVKVEPVPKRKSEAIDTIAKEVSKVLSSDTAPKKKNETKALPVDTKQVVEDSDEDDSVLASIKFSSKSKVEQKTSPIKVGTKEASTSVDKSKASNPKSVDNVAKVSPFVSNLVTSPSEGTSKSHIIVESPAKVPDTSPKLPMESISKTTVSSCSKEVVNNKDNLLLTTADNVKACEPCSSKVKEDISAETSNIESDPLEGSSKKFDVKRSKKESQDSANSVDESLFLTHDESTASGSDRRNLRERRVRHTNFFPEYDVFKKTRPVRQCSTGEKMWIESDTDSDDSFEPYMFMRSPKPVRKGSDASKPGPKVGMKKSTDDISSTKEVLEKSSAQQLPNLSDHFSDSDEEPLQLKTSFKKTGDNRNLCFRIGESEGSYKKVEEIHKSDTLNVFTRFLSGADKPLMISVDEKPEENITNTAEQKSKNVVGKSEVSCSANQDAEDKLEISDFDGMKTTEKESETSANIEKILESLKSPYLQDTTLSQPQAFASPSMLQSPANDPPILYTKNVQYSYTFPAATFGTVQQVPKPPEPINTHGLDLLSEVAPFTLGRDKLNMSTERIEKWLKDSMVLESRKRFGVTLAEASVASENEQRKVEIALPDPQQEKPKTVDKDERPKVLIVESPKPKAVSKVDVQKTESSPRKTLSSVQELLKLQKERREQKSQLQVAENQPHPKNCKCNSCVVRKGWFKNKQPPASESRKVGETASKIEMEKPFQVLTSALTKITGEERP